MLGDLRALSPEAGGHVVRLVRAYLRERRRRAREQRCPNRVERLMEAQMIEDNPLFVSMAMLAAFVLVLVAPMAR